MLGFTPIAGFGQHIEWCLPSTNGAIGELSASRDGTIFVASTSHDAQVWDAVTGKLIRSHEGRWSESQHFLAYIFSVGMADDGSHYLMSAYDGDQYSTFIDSIWQADALSGSDDFGGRRFSSVYSYFSPSHNCYPGFESDITTGRVLWLGSQYDFTDSLHVGTGIDVLYSPEADLLLLLHTDGTSEVDVLQESTRKRLSTISSLGNGTSIISHNGRYVFFANGQSCRLYEIGSHPTTPTVADFSISMPATQETQTTFSIDNHLLILGQDRTITWYSLNGLTATKTASFDLPSKVTALTAVCGPQGTVAFATEDGSLGTLQMDGTKREFTTRQGVPKVKFSRNGSQLFLADTGIQVMDTSTRAVVGHYLDGDVIRYISVNPVRDEIAILDSVGDALLDLHTGSLRRIPGLNFFAPKYSPDGNFLAIDQGQFDLRSNALTQDPLIRHAMAFAHHHPYVAALRDYGFNDTRLVVYDTVTRDTMDLYYQVNTQDHSVDNMVFSSDDSVLAFSFASSRYPYPDELCFVIAAHLQDTMVGEVGSIESPLLVWVEPQIHRIKSVSSVFGSTQLDWHYYPNGQGQSGVPLIDTWYSTDNADVSPDRSHLVTCGIDGTIRMWCLSCTASGPQPEAGLSTTDVTEPRSAAVYPNPSLGDPILSGTISRPGKLTLRVIDAIGRVVNELNLGNWLIGEFRANLGPLPHGGCYHVQVIQDGEIVSTAAVVVQ